MLETIHRCLLLALLTLAVVACARGSRVQSTAMIGESTGSKPPELEAQCQAGDMESCRKHACTNLGILFGGGYGVPQSITRAIVLFSRSCRDGDTAGCENLAAIAMAQGRSEYAAQARETFERSCANGVQMACSNLASMSMGKNASAAELEKTRLLLVRACESHEPTGCYNLAELLRTRLRESADAAQIKSLYKQACDGKVALACHRLAESAER